MTVFEDGTATTCPDCEGDLQYQTREAIVCLGCGADYVHWKTTAEHQLREVEPQTGESETVATAPVEDHELATDGGTNPETGPDGTCWNCEDAAPGALAQISVGPLALTVAVCHDCDEELEDEFASGTEGSSQ